MSLSKTIEPNKSICQSHNSSCFRNWAWACVQMLSNSHSNDIVMSFHYNIVKTCLIFPSGNFSFSWDASFPYFFKMKLAHTFRRLCKSSIAAHSCTLPVTVTIVKRKFFCSAPNPKLSKKKKKGILSSLQSKPTDANSMIDCAVLIYSCSVNDHVPHVIISQHQMHSFMVPLLAINFLAV